MQQIPYHTFIHLHDALNLISYVVLHVQICSFLNQQLGSSIVTFITGNYQWCPSTLEVNIDGMHQLFKILSSIHIAHCDMSISLIKRDGLIVDVGKCRGNMVHATDQPYHTFIHLHDALNLISYLVLLVQICSFLNQQMGSSRVTSHTGSYQWCPSTLENEYC